MQLQRKVSENGTQEGHFDSQSMAVSSTWSLIQSYEKYTSKVDVKSYMVKENHWGQACGREFPAWMSWEFSE